jgi:abequosyltransferase
MSFVQLSICISTINRADFIRKTLESIVPQVTDEVELIIVDSSSDSATEAVVRSFEAQGDNLRYLKSKVGFAEAYSKAVELARGDYCWLFTDDDLLKPGAVSAVLEAIRKNYSLILVNSEVRNEDLRTCLQVRRVPQLDNRVYSPEPMEQDQLLADTGMYLTFIGAVVIQRALWNQRIREEDFRSMFIHMIVIFGSRLPGDTLFIAYPWIVIRYGNALWRPKSFGIWMFEFPSLLWSFDEFGDWAKERVERREPWRRLRRLLMIRAMDRYSVEQYNLWLKPRLKPGLNKLLARAIASAPVTPLNLLGQFFLLLTGKVPGLIWLDLRAWRTEQLRRRRSKVLHATRP